MVRRILLLQLTKIIVLNSAKRFQNMKKVSGRLLWISHQENMMPNCFNNFNLITFRLMRNYI